MGVLKSPTIIVFLLVSPFMLAVALYIEFFLCWMHMYLQSLYLLLGLILWSLGNVSVSHNVLYFKVLFCLIWILLLQLSFDFHLHGIFFPILSLCLWVSGSQHIYGSCFCIHSASLCLLFGAFKPFTFKVNLDISVLISIFLIILDYYYYYYYYFEGAAPTAYGYSQARGWIGAVAAGHSHSNARSKPHLWTTPQLTAMPDP